MLSIFNSTDVRHPPAGGVSTLLTTVPVSTISSFGLLKRINVAGAPTGQRTCTETPRLDSEWLRRM